MAPVGLSLRRVGSVAWAGACAVVGPSEPCWAWCLREQQAALGHLLLVRPTQGEAAAAEGWSEAHGRTCSGSVCPQHGPDTR